MVPRGDRLPQLYEKLGLTGGVYHLWNLTGLEIQMNKMREELLNDGIFGIYYASAHVQEYIMEFMKQTGMLKKENMKDIEGSNNTGTTQKKNIYQKHMNVLKDYVNHIRIDKARSYLGFTNLNACEIAKYCGFENNNYFWKTFKKRTGLTPGEYRKRYKNTEV